MKVFLAFCIIAVVAVAQAAELTAEQKEKLKKIRSDCIASTHVKEEEIAKTYSGEFSESAELENYFTCMFTALRFINDKGELQLDVIRSKPLPTEISDEDREKVITTCQKFQGTPKEKISKLVYQCYLKETPTKIQLFPGAS